MITTKIISSSDKCFIDQTTDDFSEITSISMFRNERLSLQFAVYEDKTEGQNFCLYDVVIHGEMAKYAEMFVVDSIPVYSVTDYSDEVTMEADPTFLRASAGLYPDLLSHPMHKNSVPVVGRQLHAAWFDFRGDDIAPGKYPTEFCLYNGNGELVSSNTVEIEVLPVSLPEQEFKYTNWFYADCLADYYNVKPWSRRHFMICENFIRRASENGINMILMPVFTIPLDTHPSCERTTTQLVQVEKKGDDYLFDFSLCDKWIEMCERCNIRYFEISHLFTQWGATHAPKIIVKENGRKKKMFGIHTDATGEEYTRFIRSFLRAFCAYIDEKGLHDRTYFHISDEPSEWNLETYEAAQKTVSDLLSGRKVMDASSNVELYKKGVMQIPVPSTGALPAFRNENVPERWAYYCCGPWVKYSNRFAGMHLARTRSIGYQLYKEGIEGFLHWGYNFYNNMGSFDRVNPYLNPAGGCLLGDAYLVYPNYDGTPLDSLRLRAMSAAMDDIRLLKLLEKYYSKDEIVAEMEKVIGEITFENCVNDSTLMQKLRDTLTEMVMIHNE